jgi:hypothetical protein
MSEVGVGRKRLKDINLIALFIVLGKIERASRHFSLSEVT